MANASETQAARAQDPSAVAAPAISSADLRRFHLRGAVDGGGSLPAGFVPALLERLRDPDRVRTDWPVLLPLLPGGAEAPVFVPLPEALKGALEGGAAGNRVIADNLPRVERWLHGAVDGRNGAVDAASLLEEAGRALRKELQLKPASDQQLQEDWKGFTGAVPAQSRLLGFSRSAPLVLLLRAAKAKLGASRAAFRTEARELSAKLQALLDEEHRRAHARDPEALREAMGTVGMDHVDPGRLAEILGPRKAAPSLEPERERRIREAVAGLEPACGEDDGAWAVLVHDGALDGVTLDGEDGWRAEKAADPCAAALEIAAQEAARWADVFRALRVARLEAAGRFDPLRHVPWMQEFGPDSFSREELLRLPVVVALDSADRIVGGGMVSLSRLLRSGRPVHAVVPVQPARNPGAPRHDPLDGHRLELGYIGIGHRTAFVQQSSAARPGHLVEGFLRALGAPRPALHVLAAGPEDAVEGGAAWLQGNAALEGRAHPFYRYDPEAGSTWAGRMDFTENPQPEEDWPIHDWSRRLEGGTVEKVPLPFTFGDFALLDPALAGEFRLVPESFSADELAPVADWLGAPEEDALRRVPFVHAVGADGIARRLAMTRRLAHACRERSDYWHTLQELAGIRNEYVREAVRKAMEETAVHHAEELEIAKRDAAGLAMQALARRLLDLEGGGASLAEALAAPAVAPTAAPATAPIAAPAAAAPAPKPGVAEAPWIDSALCTTCNECTNINPVMFKYNANKQATIADAKAGTYAQLVKAAEKCPSKCIHPGDPLNPKEPNLEALKKRAAVFR